MEQLPEESLPEKSSKLSGTQATSNIKARRSRRTLLLLVGLLIILLGILLLPPAWRESSRREAYLPELVAEARSNPHDGRLLALLGGRQMQAGQYTAAADTLRLAIASGEHEPLLWINLAAATAASGDTPRALADLRLGTNNLPASKELSQALSRAMALQPPVTPMAMAGAISPHGPGALVSLYSPGSFLNGVVERLGQNRAEGSGFSTRERLAAAKPNDAEAQRLWGLALLRNHRLQEAGDVLQHALALAPNSPEAQLALADWLTESGFAGRATVAYLECLKLRPNWLPALLGVGKTSLQTGLNGYALTSYERATKADPKSVEAWIGLGQAYRQTGVDYAKSIAAFQNVLKLAPDRTDYYVDYADALRQAVQWPAAEDILRKRLAAAKDDALAHYLLGMVLLNNSPTPQRQTEAESETREALRLSPHNPLASLQLAQISLSKREIKEAIDLLTDALQRNPYNRNAMSVLARAYRQNGQTDMAEKVSKQADQLYQVQQRIQVLEGKEAKNILDAAVHEELARLYGQIGDSKKAMYEQNMLELLRKDPKKAEEELKKFSAIRSEVLPGK